MTLEKYSEKDDSSLESVPSRIGPIFAAQKGGMYLSDVLRCAGKR